MGTRCKAAYNAGRNSFEPIELEYDAERFRLHHPRRYRPQDWKVGETRLMAPPDKDGTIMLCPVRDNRQILRVGDPDFTKFVEQLVANGKLASQMTRSNAGSGCVLKGLAVLVAVLAGGLGLLWVSPGFTAWAISESQRQAVGDTAIAAILQQHGDCADAEATAALVQLGRQLGAGFWDGQAHITRSQDPYLVTAPGGDIVASAGLLRRVQLPGDLVFLVAEELALAAERRPLMAQIEAGGLPLGVKLMTGGKPEASDAMIRALIAAPERAATIERTHKRALAMMGRAALQGEPANQLKARLQALGVLAGMETSRPGLADQLTGMAGDPGGLLPRTSWQAIQAACRGR